ncbi:MAG: LytTR family DNA-binding domain-containing protein [Pseudomonadota bacterium]
MQIAMQHYSTMTSWPRFLTGAGILLSVTFTMLMPGTSDGLSGGALFLFWTAHVFGALLILQSVQMGLARIPSASALSPWVQVAVSGLIGAVLFTPLAGLMDWMFRISETTDDHPKTLTELVVSEFTGLVGPVTVVWVGLNATRLVGVRSVKQQERTAPEVGQPAFWDRVPSAIGRDLVALSAELHYVRVHTTKGEALVLFPFGQAVKQVEQSNAGLQIHRSHWVALAHVDEVRRIGQGGVCAMASGLELPVSRRHWKTLSSGLASEA